MYFVISVILFYFFKKGDVVISSPSLSRPRDLTVVHKASLSYGFCIKAVSCSEVQPCCLCAFAVFKIKKHNTSLLPLSVS